MLAFIFTPSAPKLFPVAYNLVKHFLSENTRQKIYILGGETLHHFTLLLDISPNTLSAIFISLP